MTRNLNRTLNRKLNPRFPAETTLKITVLLGLLGLWALPAPGATNEAIPYTVRMWQADDGLPQNEVQALAQTGDGYLWVGTREGLARFDGVRFSMVEEPGAPELKRGSITALCVLREGSLWVGVEGHGLLRLGPGGVLQRLSKAEGLPSNEPRCLLEARDGSLWVGTEGGLSRYHQGKLTNYTVRQGLGDNSVRAICEDRHGVLQIATKRGLSSLSQDGTIKTLNFGGSWNSNALRAVCAERRSGRLWVGSTDGLHSLAGKHHSFYNLGEGLPHRIINSICEDHIGQIWIGTYGGLVRVIDGKVARRPERQPALGDLVHTIFEDREGNLWVGGRDGLYRLNPARFAAFGTDQGLTDNNVMSVCEDRSGTLWLGTWGGGVDALRDGKIAAYGITNGLTHESVLSLCEGRDGSLWIGMEAGGGLNRFKGERRNSFPQEKGLISAAIRVIHEDREGRLWVGTSSGLDLFPRNKTGPYKTYSRTNGLSGNMVLAICEDEQGTLWFGTDGGLSRWRHGRFTNFTAGPGGLSYNTVEALYLDRDGTLWIGTRGGGLNRYRHGRFSACTTQQGLFSNEIYAILEDDFGYFWLSCRRGIFRVARRELDQVADGTLSSVTCTAFGRADGLPSEQCNGVAQPAGWKSRDGRLWFPTIRGVVAVEPRIKVNTNLPPVVIEEVLADKAEIQSPESKVQSPGVWSTGSSFGGAALKIPPGRGELEIRYTALSLQAPEKNRFKYMLEGVDSTWSEASPERTARYNHLAPGRYRFRVAACNNDGIWNETGATVELTLLPHYWQTWWFRAALLGAVGAALVLAYRARVARLRALEALRVQIAANLHDDVGARLTKVAMISEAAEHDAVEGDRLKPHIQAIARTTREITQAMDEIVWTINPKNDTLDNLANYIFQYTQEYFQNTGVRCRLDFPAQLPELAVSTESRHNLFMAVKEALNNVLKHAAATEVRMSLAVTEGRLSLLITDNGRGFAPEQPRARGNGLSNMKQRLERVGGRFLLESRPGSGTRICMEAPLD